MKGERVFSAAALASCQSCAHDAPPAPEEEAAHCQPAGKPLGRCSLTLRSNKPPKTCRCSARLQKPSPASCPMQPAQLAQPAHPGCDEAAASAARAWRLRRSSKKREARQELPARKESALPSLACGSTQQPSSQPPGIAGSSHQSESSQLAS